MKKNKLAIIALALAVFSAIGGEFITCLFFLFISVMFNRKKEEN